MRAELFSLRRTPDEVAELNNQSKSLFSRLDEISNTHIIIKTDVDRNPKKIRDAFKAKGYEFLVESPSNQQFPILSNEFIECLSKDFKFSIWKKVDADHTAVRFCTSWATREEAVEALLGAI